MAKTCIAVDIFTEIGYKRRVCYVEHKQLLSDMLHTQIFVKDRLTPNNV